MSHSFTSTQPKRVNTATFGLTVNGVSFAYTYIRKNACTSFKRLFRYYSAHDFAGGELIGMARHHAINRKADVEKVPTRIFVYRDPVERVISVYNNKFIQRSGADDILRNYQDVTGLNPLDCSFDQFVRLYVSRILHDDIIDAHLLPQAWHLYQINYNYAIKLSNIRRDMSSLLANEVGSRFFSKPINATSNIKRSFLDSAELLPARSIELMYRKYNQMPSNTSYASPELKAMLRNIYVDDVNMICKIEGAPSSL